MIDGGGDGERQTVGAVVIGGWWKEGGRGLGAGVWQGKGETGGGGGDGPPSTRGVTEGGGGAKEREGWRQIDRQVGDG